MRAIVSVHCERILFNFIIFAVILKFSLFSVLVCLICLFVNIFDGIFACQFKPWERHFFGFYSICSFFSTCIERIFWALNRAATK